jgi:ribosome-associated protein
MRKVAAFCDYFVIASGTSNRQIGAVADAIQEELLKSGLKPLARPEFSDQSGWIVLDYLSVIVHLFYAPVREFYALERLWGDAKKVRIASRHERKSPRKSG